MSATCWRNYVITLVLLCGSVYPYSNLLLAESSPVVLLGQKIKANDQYCFYQQTDVGYRLLTPNSLARSDIIAAAESESVNMSKALNFVAYAIFPAGVACGGSTLMWIGMGKRFGFATLLSCSAVAALVGGARHALAEEKSNLQQVLDALLAGDKQPSKYHTELLRVLQWLGSDASVACPRQPTVSAVSSW